ncbi:unnamed protein product [Blepharisma stoltei]|uniref:Uncharacterized protein n=1 Tax=Blepharisma stoltei TaxID=1481888 RepID=A0AAU9IX68_9CILI|nr:unnamed protein product [Blepharisma stoltei]
MEQIETHFQETTDNFHSTISSLSSACENTFLKEIDRDSDIGDSIREEIEKKYKKSSVNSNYIFPRQKRQRSKTSIHKFLPSPNSSSIKQHLTFEKSLPIINKGPKTQNDTIPPYPSNKSKMILSSYKKTNLIDKRNYATIYDNSNNYKKISMKQASQKRIPIHERTKSEAVRSRTPAYPLREKSPEKSPPKNIQMKSSVKSLSKENPYRITTKVSRVSMKSSQHHYAYSVEDFVYVPAVYYGK